MQIFLFYKFCTNLTWIRNSWTIFRSSHRRCSIEKLFLKLLWYSQENTRFRVSFLLKLQVFWPLSVLKRGFNTYFLVNIGKFTRTLILKNSKQPTDVFCRKRCFPMNFSKFLGAPFFQNNSDRLLLKNICGRLLLHFWKQFC